MYKKMRLTVFTYNETPINQYIIDSFVLTNCN